MAQASNNTAVASGSGSAPAQASNDTAVASSSASAPISWAGRAASAATRPVTRSVTAVPVDPYRFPTAAQNATSKRPNDIPVWLDWAVSPPKGYGTVRLAKTSEFAVGRIISAPYHVADFQQGNKLNHNRTLTHLGTWVYSKFRKLIILKTYQTHCICIPIFTYGGRGLTAKPHADEHVGLRDEADTVTNRLDKGGCKHCPILVRKAPRNKGKTTGFGAISKNSFAHFTSPVVFNYQSAFLVEGMVVGEVEKVGDIERLVGLYEFAKPFGLPARGRAV